MTSTLRAITLKELGHLLEAFSTITFNDFCASMRKSCGAQRDYCANVYPGFVCNPIAWRLGRLPQAQGEHLLAMALGRIAFAEVSGRSLRCRGEGVCHDILRACPDCGDVTRVCDLDGCSVHGPVRDEEIRKSILVFFPERGSRASSTREHLLEGLALGYEMRADYTEARGVAQLAVLLAARELVVHRDPGRFIRPLEALPPGEHSARCPVNYNLDPRGHDPRVCAWRPEELEAMDGEA